MAEEQGRWTERPTAGYEVLRVDELDPAAKRELARRRRRRAVMFLTLPGLVLASATVATAYSLDLLGTSEPTCVAERVVAPARDSFTITLLNSNDTDGLAGSVSRSLQERGFVVGEVGNADDNVYVKGAATIYHGADGRDNAALLQQQVPGSKLWADGRAGSDVQLVLGYGYDRLRDEPEPPPPAPSEITVSVYNTTFREGLAQDVSDELAERGFKPGETGNDPTGAFLPDDVAIIRFGPDGAKAAKRLDDYVDDAVLTEVDNREGESIDLVLGNQYAGLVPVTEVPEVKPFVRPADHIERPCTTS
ncbi:hypothetical protein GCM10022199_05310 [Marihabitans asiaticum]|uniref:LytR cell envelope-related transcriptional attenuator n=1 Tax=Marihabitans asiaticum TaxID=415218 RepID=A0A560WDQ7_9MICO|nr:LytR C-terminal domain-containing protein [Marihabitans asiaticum]TWD15801.1 LytR cell envelope-related transcriptional attenuator [Marihabitans asiaticum]